MTVLGRSCSTLLYAPNPAHSIRLNVNGISLLWNIIKTSYQTDRLNARENYNTRAILEPNRAEPGLSLFAVQAILVPEGQTTERMRELHHTSNPGAKSCGTGFVFVCRSGDIGTRGTDSEVSLTDRLNARENYITRAILEPNRADPDRLNARENYITRAILEPNRAEPGLPLFAVQAILVPEGQTVKFLSYLTYTA
ncbi:hypothetical protein J6590_010313 [Homalodisca vitripennis]|nr:hypothetical protein J6590_010313 [Homalodisca vitripennis]